ncbi:DedA family protein [Sphingomonas echinoides]|uniref:DedA family protein n=1 Tax=Sphingomonas echinoides TaxID=59803 RepID=UPI0024132CE6|nr:DedA family protein [Sphingomonas echinoides]
MTIETIIAKYGLFALFAGAGIEGETVVVAGGLLAHKGLFSLPGAMAAAAAGSFVADQIFFSLGRYFRDKPWVRRARAKPIFARALGLLERYPIGFIFAFRFIYGFRTISPIAIGTTKVSTKLFVMINLVAAIVWGIVFTGIGYLFGHSFEKLIERFLPDKHAILIVGGAIVGIALLLGLWRWWRGRRTQAA